MSDDRNDLAEELNARQRRKMAMDAGSYEITRMGSGPLIEHGMDADCMDFKPFAGDAGGLQERRINGRVVKRIGQYQIVEGAGPQGGYWFAIGKGEQAQFHTLGEAELHATIESGLY